VVDSKLKEMQLTSLIERQDSAHSKRWETGLRSPPRKVVPYLPWSRDKKKKKKKKKEKKKGLNVSPKRRALTTSHGHPMNLHVLKVTESLYSNR